VILGVGLAAPSALAQGAGESKGAPAGAEAEPTAAALEESEPSAASETNEASAAAGEPATEGGGDEGNDPKKEGQEPWEQPAHSTLAIGAFWSPDSDLGTPAGLALGGNKFGDYRRSYAAKYGQLEIGDGIGIEYGGYGVFNVLEMDGPVSLVLGGHLLDIGFEANTKDNSRDHFAWSMHADAGLRVGDKRHCFAAASVGMGLNSGTQSLDVGDWFRPETAALFSAVCGPLSLGGALRHIDDEIGTVAQANASAVVFLNANKSIGIGATYSMTAYGTDGDYHHIFEDPAFAFDADTKQTMLRITLQTSIDFWGGEECKSHRESPAE